MTALRNIIPHTPRSGSSLTRWNSFDDLDRVFDNFFRNAMTNVHLPSAAALTSVPVRMNISETDKAYTVTAELPGLEQKDIELTLDEGLLTISGEKSEESEEEGKTFHRVERSYGKFTRTLQLPADADENGITASMKNGVLSVTVAKMAKPEKTQKRIEIS